MGRGRQGLWIGAIAGVCLLLFLASGKLHLIRTDGIRLAACPLQLAAGRTDADGVILRRRDAIVSASRRHGLPPEMVAAIIHGHQPGLTPFRRLTDCAGSALGADLSLGPAQIRISTAASGDGLATNPLSPADFARYRAALLNPDTNIEYQARELRRLLERDVRFPGITGEELVRNPRAMALLMSEYRAGPQNAEAEDSRIGMTGLRDLRHMLVDGVYVFGRGEAETALIRDRVFWYLDDAYCDGDVVWFCNEWRSSAPYLAMTAGETTGGDLPGERRLRAQGE